MTTTENSTAASGITIGDDFSWPSADREITIALNPETGRVYDVALVGPGTPEEIWNRRCLPLVSPDCVQDPGSVADWLAGQRDTLQQILDGFEGVEFNGHNHVGRWTETARELADDLRELYAGAGDSIAKRWDAGDYLSPVRGDIAVAVREAGGNVDAVTDAELADAEREGAILDRDDLRETIQEIWDNRD